MKNQGFTLRKRLRSFRYAFSGIYQMLATETNARIHCLAAVIVLVAGIVFQISKTEWVAVLFAIGLVPAAEAMNSAIETLCDRVTTDYDEAIRRAKDLASGGVLLTALTAAVIGSIIFIPKIINSIILWNT